MIGTILLIDLRELFPPLSVASKSSHEINVCTNCMINDSRLFPSLAVLEDKLLQVSFRDQRAPTYQSWILHFSRILHISEHDLQYSEYYILRLKPLCTSRTNRHICTNTHTALQHKRDLLSGMHYDMSLESVWELRLWREDLGREPCPRNSRHILAIGNGYIFC